MSEPTIDVVLQFEREDLPDSVRASIATLTMKRVRHRLEHLSCAEHKRQVARVHVWVSSDGFGFTVDACCRPLRQLAKVLLDQEFAVQAPGASTPAGPRP